MTRTLIALQVVARPEDEFYGTAVIVHIYYDST